MSNQALKDIDIIINSPTSTSPARLLVDRQDWLDEYLGFEIEAISELKPDKPQYRLTLTGQFSPKAGEYPLTDDHEGQAPRIFIKFGHCNREVEPINVGQFTLTRIDYNNQELAGEFEFSTVLDNKPINVSCWGFELTSAV